MASSTSVAQKRMAIAAAFVAIYFRKLTFPAAHVPLKAKAFAPPTKMKLEILKLRPTYAWWKRDGGFRFEADVRMRMHNAAPLPLKIKTLNTSALLRTLGGSERYKAGYQAASGVTLPPAGSAEVDSRLVLTDLRPLMLPALFVDAVSEAVGAAWSRRAPVMDIPLEGFIKLWPTGRVDVSCVLAQPLDGADVINTCRAKLL
mmetsp:Transcript_14914/g.44532  ORF Transcript_14914/g.44532 Transcript_14914/m.44532 type:complete len:202 (+) Transcript_14914:206-811(+)